MRVMHEFLLLKAKEAQQTDAENQTSSAIPASVSLFYLTGGNINSAADLNKGKTDPTANLNDSFHNKTRGGSPSPARQ